MRPEAGYVDLNLTREGSRRTVLRRDRVEIGNSGLGSAGFEIFRQVADLGRLVPSTKENSCAFTPCHAE
jgi:hypothetical protein